MADHNSPEAIAKRKAQMAKHSPWDRWTPAEREMALKTMGGARPIVWTTDVTLAGTLTEDGKVYAFAGGPVEGSPDAAPRKRADGKVDGRSKGVRKCGICGQTGHNARTCPENPKNGGRGRRRVPPTPKRITTGQPDLDTLMSGGVPAGKVTEVYGESPRPVVETPSGEAPKPRTVADRESKRAEMRASKKSGRRCSICGKTGHNARTCPENPKNKGKTPKVKRARSRQNTCSICGGKGHNARTCPHNPKNKGK